MIESGGGGVKQWIRDPEFSFKGAQMSIRHLRVVQLKSQPPTDKKQ